MKAVKPILLISGIGVIAYAIYNYYQKQFKLLNDVQTTLVGLKIVSVSKNAVILDITSRITNISNVEATVKQMYLDCFLNGVLIGNVNEIKDISILAGKSSDIPFRFTFNPSLILGNVFNILTLAVQLKDMKFLAKGFVKVKINFATTTIPFEYQSDLKSLINKK
jgi:LEA14-like dessication related protein